ncbi:MAG: elongation factor P [Parcubacteria group bacterium]|nr:elongation factor P [Parcubacteria group bacterium]
MLTINDLEVGTVFILDGAPHEVMIAKHSHMGRGGSVLETKLRNLKTGTVAQRNFKQADVFEEADVEKAKTLFLYQHRGEFWFSDPSNPKERFKLPEALIGESARFLKPNTHVETLKFENEILAVKLPIKIDLTVIEAPPGIRGDTAQGGSKIVKLESGAELSVPLFINEDDVVRVNTETGEYVERVEKAAREH